MPRAWSVRRWRACWWRAAGEGWCFLLNGVSYATVLGALLAMRLTPTEKPVHTGSMLAHIVDGVRYVRGHLPIRSLLLLLGMVSLAGMPYAVLMPVFADRILGGGPQGLGILMSCAGGGALVGALLLAARRSPRGLGGWVPWAAFGFGLGLVGFSLSRSFWLSGALLVPTGFAMMVQMAASNTLLQMMVPDALRGRVMSLYSMMFMGMAPLGSLLAGSLAGVIGAPGTVAGGGALCMLAALWFRRRLPQIRGANHGIGGAGPGEPAADSRGAQPVDSARRPEPQSGGRTAGLAKAAVAAALAAAQPRQDEAEQQAGHEHRGTGHEPAAAVIGPQGSRFVAQPVHLRLQGLDLLFELPVLAGQRRGLASRFLQGRLLRHQGLVFALQGAQRLRRLHRRHARGLLPGLQGQASPAHQHGKREREHTSIQGHGRQVSGKTARHSSNPARPAPGHALQCAPTLSAVCARR